ncbi:MAG: fructosamine kinase family protein, partial [Catalinimonas sp.]
PNLLPRDRPALLHGNLSGSHVLYDRAGPILIDPAPSYGLRESELAWVQLMGRFDESFFDAYTEAFPLEPGFAERRPLYQLYPLLVLLLTEGNAYRGAVEALLGKYA